MMRASTTCTKPSTTTGCGKRPDAAEVEKARREEIANLNKMGVYKKVPCWEAMEITGKRPMGVRWVDGLKTSGKHGSRLAAAVSNNGNDTGMCVPTPPLEGAKLL